MRGFPLCFFHERLVIRDDRALFREGVHVLCLPEDLPGGGIVFRAGSAEPHEPRHFGHDLAVLGVRRLTEANIIAEFPEKRGDVFFGQEDRFDLLCRIFVIHRHGFVKGPVGGFRFF